MLPLHIGWAERLTIRTVDASGTEVSNIEVNVRTLDAVTASPKQFRTDSEGRTPAFELSPGLYQLIAVGPHASWMNSVKEVFVDSSTSEIVLQMRVRKNIDWVAQPEASFSSRQVSLKFSSGTIQKATLAGLRVLVRDSEGKSERWFQTDATGRVEVILPEGPPFLVLPTVVVPIEGAVHTFILLDDCDTSDQLGIVPNGPTCIAIKNSFAEIEIPTPSRVSPGQASSVPKF
jgi:hypothetical protein